MDFSNKENNQQLAKDYFVEDRMSIFKLLPKQA